MERVAHELPEPYNPVVGKHEMTYLYHIEEKTSSYYKDVYLQNWYRWFKMQDILQPLEFCRVVESVKQQ